MSERTEQPTQRKREDGRKKGQGIGRSHELSMGLTLGVGLLALSAMLPAAATTMTGLIRSSMTSVGNGSTGNDVLLAHLGDGMTGVLRMILPLALLVMAAGIGANLAAGGLVLSMHPVKFDAKRLNPISGLKRIADKQAMFRLVIATIKLAILASMVWVIVVPRVGTILSMVGADTEAIASAALGAIFQLGLVVTFLLGFIAAIDFVVQRRRALGQLKMTKDEVKRENKDSEGDPVIRGFRRRRAAQLAYGRMMDAVPTADVVVVNPVHLAIALRYDARTMKAPRIVAKGQRLMAERIKDVAREHNVPVIEDIPLARALFPRPIGSDVPPQFYRAVARLLVLVHQARRAASRAVADLRPEPQA